MVLRPWIASFRGSPAGRFEAAEGNGPYLITGTARSRGELPIRTRLRGLIWPRTSPLARASDVYATVSRMRVGEITRSGILQAIEEHDQLGKDEFRSAYGFREALSYVLV